MSGCCRGISLEEGSSWVPRVPAELVPAPAATPGRCGPRDADREPPCPAVFGRNGAGHSEVLPQKKELRAVSSFNAPTRRGGEREG